MGIQKQPKEADVIVGRNIKALRTKHGISQERLAAEVGVTFQQIQKYEKGTNRVGGSRLHAVAKALGVEVNVLFDGLEAGSSTTPPLSNEAIKVAVEFDRLNTFAQRSVKSIITALIADRAIKEAADVTA